MGPRTIVKNALNTLPSDSYTFFLCFGRLSQLEAVVSASSLPRIVL